jgi:hypothetical protein
VSNRPPSGGGWSGKPRDPNRKPFTPRAPRPGNGDRKKRDDEPPDRD